MRNRHLRDAVAVAVEALSWMELEGLSERLAFTRTTGQLHIRHLDSMKAAFRFLIETVRALNLVDKIATSILSRDLFDDLDLGKKNFLRVFICWTVLRRCSHEDSIALLEAARHVLGWRDLQDLELAFGKILSWDLGKFMQGFQDPERTAFSTFNRTWFVSYCYRVFGRMFAHEYLKSTRTVPPSYVRINTLRGDEESLLREMENDGVEVSPVESLVGIFRAVRTARPLTLTQAYRNGYFSIQDKSSCLSTMISDLKKGDMVLDLCAAPGGKTSHMAARTADSAIILSIDLSGRRMKIWRKEMKRCGVSCAAPVVADAWQGLPTKHAFDLVVVDPPCTNSGSFGKNPSSKWRMTETALRRYSEIQWEILRAAVQTVKPAGRLIYSTCSITIEENEAQIERLLRLYPEFRLRRQTPFIGHRGMRGLDTCQRLYPHLDSCNGYFIASLSREY